MADYDDGGVLIYENHVVSDPRWPRKFAYKAGLDEDHWQQRYKKALAAAVDWFELADSFLNVIENSRRQVIFSFEPPKVRLQHNQYLARRKAGMAKTADSKQTNTSRPGVTKQTNTSRL